MVTTYGISVRHRIRNMASCGNLFVWDKNPYFVLAAAGRFPATLFPRQEQPPLLRPRERDAPRNAIVCSPRHLRSPAHSG